MTLYESCVSSIDDSRNLNASNLMNPQWISYRLFQVGLYLSGMCLQTLYASMTDFKEGRQRIWLIEIALESPTTRS